MAFCVNEHRAISLSVGQRIGHEVACELSDRRFVHDASELATSALRLKEYFPAGDHPVLLDDLLEERYQVDVRALEGERRRFANASEVEDLFDHVPYSSAASHRDPNKVRVGDPGIDGLQRHQERREGRAQIMSDDTDEASLEVQLSANVSELGCAGDADSRANEGEVDGAPQRRGRHAQHRHDVVGAGCEERLEVRVLGELRFGDEHQGKARVSDGEGLEELEAAR